MHVACDACTLQWHMKGGGGLGAAGGGVPRELCDTGSLKDGEGARRSEWEQDIPKKGRYALHNWLCPVARLRAEGRDLLAVMVGGNQRRV